MQEQKSIDCRGILGSTCSLFIAGHEDEVFETSIDHFVRYHGLENSERLREIIRRHMQNDDNPQEAPGFRGKEFEKLRASHN
jgi:hypothetical protein